MRIDTYVGRAVASWILLTVLMAGGLVWMATAVESARHGVWVALGAALLAVPAVLVPLTPLLCAVGAGLAAARFDGRGERIGFASLGLGPLRTARAALVVGLGVGVLQWVIAGHVVYRAEATRSALVTAGGPEWVWLEHEAYRVADGARVSVTDGRITTVRFGRAPGAPGGDESVAPATLAEARMRQEPRIASAGALSRATLATAALERAARLARVAACGGLAVLGWLPVGPRPASQVGRVLALALAWAALDLVLQAMGAQGQIPILVGAAGATGLLWFALVLSARFSKALAG